MVLIANHEAFALTVTAGVVVGVRCSAVVSFLTHLASHDPESCRRRRISGSARRKTLRMNKSFHRLMSERGLGYECRSQVQRTALLESIILWFVVPRIQMTTSNTGMCCSFSGYCGVHIVPDNQRDLLLMPSRAWGPT